jgi:hypothetical protein
VLFHRDFAAPHIAKHKHMQISAGPTGLTVDDNLRSGNDNGIQQAVERTKLANEFSTRRAGMKETQRSPQVVGSDIQLLAGKEEEVGACIIKNHHSQYHRSYDSEKLTNR